METGTTKLKLKNNGYVVRSAYHSHLRTHRIFTSKKWLTHPGTLSDI